MTHATWEQFGSALRNPAQRGPIGLIINDADAEQLLTNETWASDYYNKWVLMAEIVADDDEDLFDTPADTSAASRPARPKTERVSKEPSPSAENMPRKRLNRKALLITLAGIFIVAGAAGAFTLVSANAEKTAIATEDVRSTSEQSFVTDVRALTSKPSTEQAVKDGADVYGVRKFDRTLIAYANDGCTMDLTNVDTRATLTTELAAKGLATEATAAKVIDRIAAYCYS